jgi:hypothetical protein
MGSSRRGRDYVANGGVSIRVGDSNGDAGSFNASVRVWLGNGDGSFSPNETGTDQRFSGWAQVNCRRGRWSGT